ncbi:MAG: hypothetical protein GKR88_11160 [Flavobacteriaceae bacterium]|nr:MAG: hypothetical protein GKR88_11160 [Flavobacteriaceae bacterium]
MGILVPYNDFIYLDFSFVGADTLVILIHGLKGSSESAYMIAATAKFNRAGLEILSVLI